MKVLEMWVDCHATNGLVLWVLHGQECQRMWAARRTSAHTRDHTLLGREKKKTLAVEEEE